MVPACLHYGTAIHLAGVRAPVMLGGPGRPFEEGGVGVGGSPSPSPKPTPDTASFVASYQQHPHFFFFKKSDLEGEGGAYHQPGPHHL